MKHLLSLALSAFAIAASAQTTINYDPLVKYNAIDSVRHIVSVRYTGGTDALVSMYVKNSDGGNASWDEVLSCTAFVGSNGVGKVKEGDRRTPLGDYGMITAFGIKPNPGTKLPYVDVDDDTYCCADRVAYNKIINVKHVPHKCRGEHMIKYEPDYNYGFFFDYNKERIVGKGSALFFHCTGDKNSTAGCIAVPEEHMATILKTIDLNTRLIITDNSQDND